MNVFKGRHFSCEIILWAVRWYYKYGISYRELKDMLTECGVNVDHITIYRWVQRVGQGSAATVGKQQPNNQRQLLIAGV